VTTRALVALEAVDRGTRRTVAELLALLATSSATPEDAFLVEPKARLCHSAPEQVLRRLAGAREPYGRSPEPRRSARTNVHGCHGS
jgi:hypothetical protein